jgi:hypothetical protein
MPWEVPPFAKQGLIDIDDVVSEEEARKVATAIYDSLRLKLGDRQPGDVFHVIMAGGRKKLLARSCDSLYHVVLRGSPIEGFFYPRPTDPPEFKETFALHPVPCLALGVPIARAGIKLDVPFGEILSEVQRRLVVDEREARLEVDLARGSATYKGVELRFIEKRSQALALLAILAWLRREGTDGGWLGVGRGTSVSREQAFRYLRCKELLDVKGAVDRLGQLPPEERDRELCNALKVPHAPGSSARLDEALGELALLFGKLASAIDRAAESSEPPLDRFLSRESFSGPCGEGLHRRIGLSPDCISLVSP